MISFGGAAATASEMLVVAVSKSKGVYAKSCSVGMSQRERQRLLRQGTNIYISACNGSFVRPRDVDVPLLTVDAMVHVRQEIFPVNYVRILNRTAFGS